MTVARSIVVFVGLILAAASCSSSGADVDGTASADGVASTTTEATTTTTTTTQPPLPPELRVPERARAEIGQEFSDAIVAVDPNGEDTVIRVVPPTPQGFALSTNSRGRIIGFDWSPTEAGEWEIDVSATNSAGLETVESITLVGRHRRDRDSLVAMGGSVAAGFGRDRTDFAGTDECFRSEDDAYGVLVGNELIAAGSLAADADVFVLACSGATSTSLAQSPVQPTNEAGELIGEPGSQLDLAIEMNPTVITLTIGAAEMSLFNIETISGPVDEEGAEYSLNEVVVDGRIEVLEENLAVTLDRLVHSTDAHVVVTTWYDPTAEQPVGFGRCADQCFVDLMSNLINEVNAAILAAIDQQPEGRVSVARLDGDADVWEASNGFGPDFLRDGLGPLQGLADEFTGGSSATCADDSGPEVELVSTLDCAHPNSDGHRAIAAVVAEVLLSI